ncbi:MAG: hypothetical protein HYY16_11580 [Planctomycetes bacterium]|nr:hypothetical protein [Planctomycetota bacterium]
MRARTRALALSGALCLESIAASLGSLWLFAGAPSLGVARVTLVVLLQGCAGACAMAAASHARRERLSAGALEGLLALAVPLVGSCAVSLIILIHLTGRVGRSPRRDLENALTVEAGMEALFDWRTALALERELRVAPIGRADLGHPEKLQEAFIRVWRSNAVSDLDLLTKALEHADPQIRLRARILLVRLQDRAVAVLLKAREEAGAQPSRPEPRRRAGRACLLLSRLDGEPETAQTFRRLAVLWLRSAHALEPADRDSLMELALTEAGVDPAAARERFLSVLDGRPGDLRALLGAAECSYRLGDRERLGADCEAILQRASEGAPEREAAEYLVSQMEEVGDECWVDA